MKQQKQLIRQNTHRISKKKTLKLNIPASDLNKAINGTEHAIHAAEADGVVTQKQDDMLTSNASNIGKLVQNAKLMVDLLEKNGLKGKAYDEACKHLERLRLQEYRALAADRRLNCNEDKIKKQKQLAENNEIQVDMKPFMENENRTLKLHFNNANELRFFRSLAHKDLKKTRDKISQKYSKAALYEKHRQRESQHER